MKYGCRVSESNLSQNPSRCPHLRGRHTCKINCVTSQVPGRGETSILDSPKLVPRLNLRNLSPAHHLWQLVGPGKDDPCSSKSILDASKTVFRASLAAQSFPLDLKKWIWYLVGNFWAGPPPRAVLHSSSYLSGVFAFTLGLSWIRRGKTLGSLPDMRH